MEGEKFFTRKMTNLSAVFLTAILVLASVGFATHTSTADLEPEWSAAGQSMDYTVTFYNNASSTHAIGEVRIYRNDNYTNFTCNQKLGWILSEPAPGICNYYGYPQGVNTIPVGGSEYFTFSATTPQNGCNWTWQFETRDITFPNQGSIQYLNDTTSVDDLAPNITKEIIGPQSGPCPPGDGEVCWVRQNTQINITVEELGVCGISGLDFCEITYTVDGESPVQKIYQDLNGETFWNYIMTFDEDSLHVLNVTCYDIAGNNVTDIEKFRVDDTPPKTTKTYGDPHFPYTIIEDQYPHWITTHTPVTLVANDPDPTGHGCNISNMTTYYRNVYKGPHGLQGFCEDYNVCMTWQPSAWDDCGWTEYTRPFFKNEESCHIIEYYSVDELGNKESVKHQCVFVEDTPPVGTKEVGLPNIPCSKDESVTGEDSILILENKNSTWQPITGDGIQATLEYNDMGPEFEYELTATGLQTNTQYSLIYYADEPDRFNNWGGDNPGALIVEATSDSNGNLVVSGSAAIGMNLPSYPDANMDINEHNYCGAPDFYSHCTGAKIWLVPSSDYSEPKLTAWNPDNYLFETDLMNYTFAECFWVRDHVTEINLSCTDLQPHPVGYGEACFRISFDIVHWLTNSVYCPLLGGTMQGPDDNDYCCVDEGTTITFQEDSLHNLEFYCVDALKNRNNETDLEYFRVDSQPPIINKTLIGPQVGTCPPRPGTNDTCWIKDWAYENGTTIHIEAYDNNTYENCTVGNVTCDWHYYLDGSYRIGGTDMPPSFDIRFSEDTVHELHITCRDALGNEETDVETFYVDSQPPNTIKWYVGPQVPDEGYPKWINSKTEVHLNATDAPNAPCAVGVNKTYWRNTLVDDINCWEEHECQMHAMGDGIWTEYLLPFHKPDQSCHLIEYFSVDLLGNEEGVKKQCVFVDNTPPEWNKTIGNPFMETGEQVEICENVSSSGDCAYYDSGSSYSNKSNTSVVIDITNINNGSQTCCDSMCVEGAASAIGGSGSLDVIFVMDTSGSMSWNDPNESRKDGAKNLIDILPEGSQVAIAVIDFDNYANIIQDFTFNHTEAKEAIDTLDASGGTNIGNAVDLANEHLINNGRSGSAWVEILFTDGSGSYSPQYTTNAANAGIVIHTMGLGSGVNETLLKEIANGTGGTYTYVDDPANLSVAFPGLTLTNIIKVTVNNNVATLYPDGSFIYCSVDLAVGDNTITAIATATDNATGYDEVVLTRLLQDQCNQTNGTVCHNETVIHVSNKTQINLTCTDRDRHPVGKESVCFKVSYDYPDWGYITDAYCNYYSGTLNAENYCCIYTGGASFVFQFREETMHNLEFYCVDGLNNEGTEDIEYFKVDSIAPTTTQSYHGAYYLNETTNATYIDTASWINLSAVDGGGVCTIGVNETYWQNMIVDDYYCNTPANCAQWDPTNLDSEKWNTYTGSIYKENESCHILAYYSVDKLENDENVQWQCFFVDKKPPITEKTYIGPFFEEGGIKWITSSTNVTLFAYDPEPHPSGVNRTYYKDIYLNDSDDWHYCYNNCSGWTQDARYGLPTAPEPYNPTGYKYTGLEESCHIIEYYSVDNVNKTETLNYQCVFVDNTAPVPDKKVGKPSSYCDNTSGNCTWEWKVTTMTPITLSCDDQGPHPSDHSIVHWRVWWDRTQNWTEWNTTVEGTEIYLEEECLHQLEFYCTDAVGHESEKDLEWIKVKGGAFNITLNPKWNLISVPFVMTENSIEKVFEDIAGKVISVWTYDGEADEWYVYTPGPGTDTLTEMKPGWGYWVLMNTSAMEGNPVQLTIGGSLFSEAATPPSKKVVPGWNLIGYYGTSGELGYNGPVGNGDCAYCTLYSLVDTVFGTERWSSLVTYWGPDSPSWKYLGLYDEMDAGAGYWMEIDVEDTYSFSTSCGFCGP